MTGKKKRRKEPEGTEELRLSLMINKRFGMKLYSYTYRAFWRQSHRLGCLRMPLTLIRDRVRSVRNISRWSNYSHFPRSIVGHSNLLMPFVNHKISLLDRCLGCKGLHHRTISQGTASCLATMLAISRSRSSVSLVAFERYRPTLSVVNSSQSPAGPRTSSWYCNLGTMTREAQVRKLRMRITKSSIKT